MRQFHARYGAGALVATPLLAGQGTNPHVEIKGITEGKAFGALLVDLDLEPGTPVDLRCKQEELPIFSNCYADGCCSVSQPSV